MTKPTKAQVRYVLSQGFEESVIFDATGLSFEDRKKIMSELGKIFAIGVQRCSNSAHVGLKLKHGHCPECNPVALQRAKYYSAFGHVYVAFSEEGKLSKVGSSRDAATRDKSLNRQRYGGYRDWRVVEIWETHEIGRIEILAHKLLKRYQCDGVKYRSDGTHSSEAFACHSKVAVGALRRAIKAVGR